MTLAARDRRSSVLRPDVVATVVVLCGDTELASWPVVGRGHPALAVVDELVRLQLTARRLGLSIRLRAPSVELVTLLELLGLDGILPRAGS